MVIDFRLLDAKTKTYSYPIPNMVLKLRDIMGYKFFSKFDCKSGFHQLRLTEDSKKLTAFTVPNGFYEWNVLPFGYKNAPGRFQSFMDSCFKDLQNCVVYIDDILLYSRTYEEHIRLLEIFMEIISRSGINLSNKKTELFKNQIEFLGHEIDIEGVKVQEHIITKIIEFVEDINTRKELQQFMGIINRVREFIPNLSEILLPLQKLLKKDIEFIWTTVHKKALIQIKEICLQ